MDVAPDLEPQVQAALSELQPSCSTSARPFTLGDEGLRNQNLRTALQQLEKEGLAARVATTHSSTSWVMTATGRKRLQVLNMLVGETIVLKPREGLPITEYTIFELHCLLQQAGWTCRMKCNRHRRKGVIVSGMPAYQIGGEKIWYLRPTATGFQKWYFIALLKAEDHNEKIEHCISDKWYRDLLQGHVQLPSQRSKAFEIVSEEKVHWGLETK